MCIRDSIYETNLQYTSKSIQAVANSNVDGFTKYPVTSLGVGYHLKKKNLKYRSISNTGSSYSNRLTIKVSITDHLEVQS